MKAPQGVETSVTIEVGPLIFYGPTHYKAEQMAKRYARQMEEQIRGNLRVGKRNPVVKLTVTTERGE